MFDKPPVKDKLEINFFEDSSFFDFFVRHF